MNLSQSAQKRLVEALLAHEVDFRLQDDWLILESGAAISCACEVSDSASDWVNVELDIDVSLPGGRLITESFAGTGDDEVSAFDASFENFLGNSLDVLLAAFANRANDDQVLVEKWKVDGVEWTAVVGGLGMRGVPTAPPQGIYTAIEKAVRDTRLSDNVHWFRLFYGQHDTKTMALELLFDNLEWPSAKEHFAAISWEPKAGYYSLRTFLVLLRKDPIVIRFLDEPEGLRTGLEIVRSLHKSQPGLSDDGVYRSLTAAGVSPDLAERIIVFTPLGFSSVLLEGARFPTSYEVFSRDGAHSKISLASEPAFKVARAAAVTASDEELASLGGTCAIASCARKMLRGAPPTPENLSSFTFTPPVIVIPRFRPKERANGFSTRRWWKCW